MSRREFWTKQRMLPGQATAEETYWAYRSLKRLHPPSSAAMLIGAIGSGWGTRRLLVGDVHVLLLVLLVIVAAVVGAWLGLLAYWLLRLLLALAN